MTRTITPGEIDDRIAIRELIDAYAHCADRRYAKGQMTKDSKHTNPCTAGEGFVLIGATRFELATSWSQTRRSTKLSYTPSVSWTAE